MKNWRMTTGVVVVVAVVVMVSRVQAQDFEIIDDEHLDVTTSYNKGTLRDFSTAYVFAGGSINNAFVYDNATLSILNGGSIDSLQAGSWDHPGGNVNISGGSVGWLDALKANTVYISDSSVGRIIADWTDINITNSTVGSLTAYSNAVNISGSNVMGNMQIGGSHMSISDSRINIDEMFVDGCNIYLSGQGEIGSVLSPGDNRLDFSGINVGGVHLHSNDHLNISNGSISRGIFLGGGSYASIGGDVGGDDAVAVSHSTLNISGDLVGGIGSHLWSHVQIEGSVGGSIFGTGGLVSVGGNVGGNVRLYSHDDPFLGHDKGRVNIDGSVAGGVETWNNSAVSLHGDVKGTVQAHDESSVNIFGGTISEIWALDFSSVFLHGYSFELGDGLWWDDDRETLLGTGLLSGTWYDGTGWSNWTAQIMQNDDTATIMAIIPEPATLLLLGIGGIALRRKVRK